MPADKWDQYAQPSGGDKWEQYASAPELPPDLRAGAPGSSGERFISGAVDALNPVPGIKQIVQESADPKIGLKQSLESHFMQPQAEQFRRARQAFGGAPGTEYEHMSPAGRISSGIGHGLAGALPLVGPSAAATGEQIGSGDVAGGLGSASGLIGSLAAPDAIRGVGRGMKRAAEPVAETAMGVVPRDRLWDANPGRAILDESTGVRPSTIRGQLNTRGLQLTKQADIAAAGASGPASLVPAEDVATKRIGKAAGVGATATAEKLQPMLNYVSGPAPAGFKGNIDPSGNISSFQSPAMLRNMRQEFPANFNVLYGENPPKPTTEVGRGMYRAMSDEEKRAVPEFRELAPRIQNIMAATEPVEKTERKMGLIGRTFDRLARPTGALTGAATGAYFGGAPGAAAGLAAPLLLTDPTVQMIAARGLDLGGKAMSNPLVSPGLRMSPSAMPVGRAIQAAPLVRPVKPRQPQ